jgi:hypothetical protein
MNNFCFLFFFFFSNKIGVEESPIIIPEQQNQKAHGKPKTH